MKHALPRNLKAPNALGITGTPCTGKKTIAPLVASRLGMTYVELNAIARRLPLSASEGEFEVDVRKLRSSLLRGRISGAVVSGHLLPAVLKDGELDFLAVLRCEPMVLKAEAPPPRLRSGEGRREPGSRAHRGRPRRGSESLRGGPGA